MTPITRRDAIFGLGGGLAGAFLTPLPWTVLDNVAIWTQHREGLPVPRGGELTFRAAACTLCPGGCALRVRSVGGRPVFATGERAHPLGGGACPFGLGLHHLAHHPLRLSTPARIDAAGRITPIARDAAVSLVATVLLESARLRRSVLVLDQRPGRTVSRAYRELLAALPEGVYASPDGEGATLATLEAHAPGQRLGLDLEHTRTLLSFGAPVLEGWGRPGRMLGARAGLRIVQLDTWRSPSAMLADEWLAIRPGGEGPLALALSQVLVAERLVRPPSAAVQRVLADFTPARVAAATGLEPAAIAALARSLVAEAPAVAIGGGDPGGGPLRVDDENAIALLNVVLGNPGRPGGIVSRRELPDSGPALLVPEQRLAEVPDGRAGLLLLDGSDAGRALPWAALERKLAPGALVVSLSPFLAGATRHAHLVVPSPAPLESYDEVLPTPDAARASYAVSAPITSPPAGATEAIALLQAVAAAAEIPLPTDSHEQRLRARAAAVVATGRGRLFLRKDGGFSEQTLPSADDFWQGLVEGGCWVDAAEPGLPGVTPPLPSAASVARWLGAGTAPTGLALVATGARGAAGGTPAAPILTKLYQESDLRPSVATAAMSPDTARRHGLTEGHPVRLESPAGIVEATLRIDTTLPPGRVALAAGPETAALHGQSARTAEGALPLAVVDADLTWRGTRVSVREA